MKGRSMFVVSVCALMIAGCGEKEDPQQKEIAQLREQLATLHDMMQKVNSVYADLETARSKEGTFTEGVDQPGGTIDTRRLMLKRIQEIGAVLKESHKTVSALEAKAATYRGDIAELRTLVNNLKQMLSERDRAIATLKSGIGSGQPRFSDVQFDRKLRQLARGLNSTSSGERADAARAVRDLFAAYPDRSYIPLVIPLMRVLKNTDEDIPVRILAALALHDLRSERGDFAIRRAGEFTDNVRLKQVCAALDGDRIKQENRAHAERLEVRKLDDQSAIARR